MMRLACLGVVVTALIASTAFGQDNASLEAGKYDLTLLAPMMSAKNKAITVPAEVKYAKDVLEIHTQGVLGNKVTLAGAITNGTVKVGMTAIEKKSILSFHYIGKLDADGGAQGKFHTFIDGKPAFSGDWTLKKIQIDPAE